MRKSKEKKVIEHSELVINDLQSKYQSDDKELLEYNKLSQEYKKLNKRFNKILQMTDNIGKNIIVNNDNLKDSVDYTIKTAREKIINNLEDHRKTKDILAKTVENEKQKDDILKKELDLAYKRIDELENTLEFSTTKNSEKEVTLEINLPQYRHFTYEDIFNHEAKKSTHNTDNLHLAKLTIDNFTDIKYKIEKEGNIRSFLRGVTKYLDNLLSSSCVVFHLKDDVFYLVFCNLSLEEIQSKIDIANIHRNLNDDIITFSIGLCQYFNNEDTFVSINKKLDLANKEASSNSTQSSCIIKQ